MVEAAQDPIGRIIQSTVEFGRIMRQQMFCAPGAHVNVVQVHALMVIGEQPGITMKELAGQMHVTSPSATSLINRLVLLKWVDRKHDTKNRKLVRLKLTQKGVVELRRKQEMRATVLRRMFSQLSEKEQETLAALHEKLLRSYQHSSSSSPLRP